MPEEKDAQKPLPMGTAIFTRLANMVAREWQPDALDVRVLPGHEVVQPEDHRTYGAGEGLTLPVRGFQLHREVQRAAAVIALKVRFPGAAVWLAATQDGRLALQVQELPLSLAAAVFEDWFDLNVWRAFQGGESSWQALAQWLGIAEREPLAECRRFGDQDLLRMAIFG